MMETLHASAIAPLLQTQWSLPIPKGKWILGLRGCLFLPDGMLREKVPDYENWNCRILLMNGMAVKKVYEATTVPGKPYVQRGLSGKGGPLLVPGVYQYHAGIHRGFPAYNASQPLALFRNKNKDWNFDPAVDPLEISNPGINLHYGGGRQIKTWSAGCQVVNVSKLSEDYKIFTGWVKKATYILVPFNEVLRGSLSRDYRCLMQGSSGDLVKKAQEALKAPVTGVYKQDMLKFVQAYQRAKNVSPDTLLGPTLLKSLKV